MTYLTRKPAAKTRANERRSCARESRKLRWRASAQSPFAQDGRPPGATMTGKRET